MKLHISQKEIQFGRKQGIFSSFTGAMILQVLTIGLFSTLLFSAKVIQDSGLPTGFKADAEKQLALFKQICWLVREAGQDVSPSHMPDKLKMDLISLLRQAANFSKDKSQLNYLRKLAQNFGTNKFVSTSFIPSLQEGIFPNIVFVSTPDNKKLNVYVLLADADATRHAVDSLKIGIGIAEDYPLKTRLSGLYLPRNPLIRVCKVFCASRADQMVLNIPLNHDELPNSHFLLILLEDVIHGYFASHIQPMGQSILEAQWQDKIDAQTYFTVLLLHRISHYYGPVEVMVPKTGKPVSERLKDYYYVFEEIRADTAFLTYLSLWKNLNLSVNKNKMFPTFLVTLIDRLKSGANEKSMLPYLVELNYLLEQGGWFYDINQRSLSVNTKKFAEGTKLLLKQSLDILQRGSHQEAEDFIKRYEKIPKELNEVISRYTKSHSQPVGAKSD